MSGHPIIQCHGVTKTFGSTSAVRNVGLDLAPGEILALLGPSGSGKSTLLRLMAGFEVPDDGTVTFDGRIVSGQGKWVPPEERGVGMVFQDYALFPHLTVFQNVIFGLKGWSKHDREQRANQVLDMVSLSSFAQRYPYQLSGGEQQRVALARSLAPRPVALLLDEPFSNLDTKLRLQLRSEVKNILHASGVPAVHVTHVQQEALYVGDKVGVMNAGILEQVGTPEEIFHHPGTRFVAQFVGSADFLAAKATEEGLVTEIAALRPATPIPIGAAADVMVRPDDVRIRPSSNGAGTVISRAFSGMHYSYGLRLPSGAVVHSLQHHSAIYQPGELMEVFFEPNQSLTCFLNSDSVPGVETDQVFSASTFSVAS